MQCNATQREFRPAIRHNTVMAPNAMPLRLQGGSRYKPVGLGSVAEFREIGGSRVRMANYSVVVPVRTTDEYLSQSLESIALQSVLPRSTYVIINGSDGSNCQSAEVCVDFDFVTPVLIQPLGMVPAVVQGISMVKDEIIMFLDSDDLWVADKAERQLAVLDQRPEVDSVSSRTQNFRELQDGSCVDLASETAGLLGATAFRSSVFTRFGGIDAEASHFTFF